MELNILRFSNSGTCDYQYNHDEKIMEKRFSGNKRNVPENSVGLEKACAAYLYSRVCGNLPRNPKIRNRSNLNGTIHAPCRLSLHHSCVKSLNSDWSKGVGAFILTGFISC